MFSSITQASFKLQTEIHQGTRVGTRVPVRVLQRFQKGEGKEGGLYLAKLCTHGKITREPARVHFSR